jgi:hypothetical protein
MTGFQSRSMARMRIEVGTISMLVPRTGGGTLFIDDDEAGGFASR